MAKAVCADSDANVRPATPAICVRHPTSNQQNQEMVFCFDCNLAFCTFCQLADDTRTNHKPHRTIKMTELVCIRKERIALISDQLKQYIVKHDSINNEMNNNINEKQKQIQLFNNMIDQFVQRLHQEVEDLKVRAKDMIKNKATLIWDRNPITSIQKIAEETFVNIRQVRASLEYEIRRCEMDELTMAERSKEMDALSDQLAAFLQSQIQLPAASAFDLKALRTQLQASIAQLEIEMSLSQKAFVRTLDSRVMFLHPDRVRLVELQAVDAQKLIVPSDKNKSPLVNGVAQEEDSDIVYITDNKNPSKIKSLDLKTHRIAEVFSCPPKAQLKGLFAVIDRPNRPFIVTTEQTSSPVSIRVNVLQCKNMSEQLAILQTVTLQESKTDWSSFATCSKGSLFCAINGSSLVHEICRTPGAAGAPFKTAAKTHRLPDVIRYMCGFQCDGECRLAASFDDYIVRVFRATGDGLCELQLLRARHADWNPRTLVGLEGGAFCIGSYFTNPADSKGKYGIELCAADARGALSTPRQLMQFTNKVSLWCHLRAPDASNITPRIVAAEWNEDLGTTTSLRVFCLQQD